jgi:hypothetical protein
MMLKYDAMMDWISCVSISSRIVSCDPSAETYNKLSNKQLYCQIFFFLHYSQLQYRPRLFISYAAALFPSIPYFLAIRPVSQHGSISTQNITTNWHEMPLRVRGPMSMAVLMCPFNTRTSNGIRPILSKEVIQKMCKW